MSKKLISKERLHETLTKICVLGNPQANDEDRQVITTLTDTVFQMLELEADGTVYPTYSQMVKRLFKTMPEMSFGSVMHAAVGIAGEASELLNAKTVGNIIEECGDIEFYMEALKQNFLPQFQTDGYSAEETIQSVCIQIVSISGNILDIVKKSWAYGKTLNALELTSNIVMLETNLSVLYSFLGVTAEEVRHKNKVKLVGPGGRYADTGAYSDEAAIARADKGPVEASNRSFIGQGDAREVSPAYTGKV